MDKPAIGQVGWIDLTVKDASQVRDFYAKVVGWKGAPISMGDYNDYNMLKPEDGTPAAGICHARGANADIPPHWMIYVTVKDIELSVAACKDNGGRIIGGIRNMGDMGRYCFIEDPAGAVCALYQHT